MLPRKYRLRLLNARMSRFFKFALSFNGSPVPFKFIANDGNFVVNPTTLTALDEQCIAERYDIVVDFSAFHPVTSCGCATTAAGPQVAVTPTPNPTPDSVFFTTPEILPEGDPRPRSVTGTGGTG